MQKTIDQEHLQNPRPSWCGFGLFNGPSLYAKLERVGVGDVFNVTVKGMVRAEGLNLLDARRFAERCLAEGVPDKAVMANRESRERPASTFEINIDWYLRKGHRARKAA